MPILQMHNKTYHITPFMPRKETDMLNRSLEILERSAALVGKLNPITMQGLTDLLRITNTYYSNLIEDHKTHPIDIERALAENYDRDPAKRDLQIEARVHLELERDLDLQIASEPVRPTAPDFICSIHRRFYGQLPDRFKMLSDSDGKEHVTVVPGRFRPHHVEVGNLVPPDPDAIEMFMAEFDRRYDLERFGRTEKLPAIAAAHHRLLWIHPFPDGNGRVARLFTGACMKVSEISGYGLWSINRGFARFKQEYMAALATADAKRQGDLDGRGHLSEKGLNRFCRFFLDTCLDQIQFMDNLLDLSNLLARIEQYIRLRSNRLIPGAEPIRPEALYLIKEAFTFGNFARGQVTRITGLKERTARKLLSQMINEGMLVSDTPKGPVRMNFSAQLLPYWFPEL
ncbi:MAG: Fic family protein [Candidatus Desulfatibia sp.]|uniref:Fic family protein n=1 Tax=Candidatus Desulfatibia sp. TaxID=3101189 RepID=UPI002F2BACED